MHECTRPRDGIVSVIPGIMSAVAPSPRRNQVMGLQEYLLLALVILLPLVIAVVVTLWTLEQARLRSKKNRKRPAKMAPPSRQADLVEASGSHKEPGQ
jgi:hypothetical protein